MFHNAIFSLIFSLFCIFSFILTQTIRGTVGDSSFMLQYGFAHFISILKSTLFWFVAVSFFIYFHPQNIDWYQRRMAKKNAKKILREKRVNYIVENDYSENGPIEKLINTIMELNINFSVSS